MEKRRSLTKRQRVKLFDEHRGICCRCETKIMVGEPWIAEHINPLEISKDDSPSNMGLTHIHCAKEKTKVDQKNIAKVYRIRAKHIGVKAKSRMPGSRASGLKKKFDGTVVSRQTGEPIR